MGKFYGHWYHFGGCGSTTGNMMCRACGNKIDEYADHWMEAQEDTEDYDWQYVTWHRKCCKDQSGWERIERKEKKRIERVKEIKRDFLKYDIGDGKFEDLFYVALEELGLIDG